MNNLNKIFFFLIFVSVTFAQSTPPATDIYLVEMQVQDGQMHFSKPYNITNRDGYDNQPMFLNDGQSLLYTSIREDKQADIYQYHLADSSITRLTDTKESEYSPTIMLDSEHFSVVRVEADSSQRLWKFPFTKGEPSVILSNVQPVGYHAWLNVQIVALFILGEPHTLLFANTRTGESREVIGNIGRSLHRIPNRDAISFVHKISEKEWWIKRVDVDDDFSSLVPTLEGSEDYAWMPDGTILMGQGAKLFRFDPDHEKEKWIEVHDFGDQGLRSISRIAVSPLQDRLALVFSKE